MGGIPIPSVSCSKLLKVLYRYDMVNEFFKFVNSMKKMRVDPDAHQYYQMLKMAAKVGNSMDAQFCFEQVLECDGSNFLKDSLYGILIMAYSKEAERAKVQGNTGNSDKVLKVIHLFDEMVREGCKPSDGTIARVIQCYLYFQDIDSAKKVIEEHREGLSFSKNVVKDLFTKEREKYLNKCTTSTVTP